jgi:hypothetical protein
MKRIIPLVCLLYTGLAFVNAQNKPGWVDKPTTSFPDRLFVSAVGSAKDRRQAETGALGGLTAYFKQSITNSINIRDTERQENGSSVLSVTELSQTIQAVSAMDSLIGAEIKDTWNDRRSGTWYAAAVMEKAKCAPLYAGELNKTILEINNLIDISAGVSFETISKCRQAMVLIGKADVFALVLSMLGGQNRQVEISNLSIAAANAIEQAKAIPVDVRVTAGDRNGRIRSAFAGVFTTAGFKTGSRNSRYALEATMVLTEAPKNQFYNARYTVDAVLKDTQEGIELFSYNIASRESHTQSQEEANNRVYIGAVRKIEAEFPEILQEYLDAN